MKMDEEQDNPNVSLRRTKGKGKTQENFIEGSIECVSMIDESTFVSGGDSGYVFRPSKLYSSSLHPSMTSLFLSFLRSKIKRKQNPNMSSQIHQSMVNTEEETHLHTGTRPWNGRITR